MMGLEHRLYTVSKRMMLLTNSHDDAAIRW